MSRPSRLFRLFRRAASALALGAATLPAGCLNYQEAYDHEARRQCRQLPDEADRRGCLASVDENARERRTENQRRAPG